MLFVRPRDRSSALIQHFGVLGSFEANGYLSQTVKYIRRKGKHDVTVRMLLSNFLAIVPR